MILHILPPESWTAFAPGLSLQGCLHSKEPWQLEIVSRSEPKNRLIYSLKDRISLSRHRSGMLMTHYKIFGFPKLGVPVL